LRIADRNATLLVFIDDATGRLREQTSRNRATFIRDQQLLREPERRSDVTRRRDQHNPRLFKVG
jgi:hypothetical protein